MDTLWVVFIGVVSLALLEAVYSLKGGRDYRRLFRLAQERVTQGGEAGEDRLPPVSLILPCRGIDPGLQTNLGAFLTLNYPDFQILFVTDDRSDPCVPLLKALVAGPSRVPARVLIAGPARRRGQKVHNLLHAVEFLRDQDEVLVFGDSDIRPGSGWLKALVETALIPDTGIATGFRWYLPQNGSFASVLRSVWNAGIASLLSRSDNLFAWGGAMAIPRKLVVLVTSNDELQNRIDFSQFQMFSHKFGICFCTILLVFLQVLCLLE
ncbi:MAG: glycosyltransferase, partial [Acidobacteriota bacterium]